MKRALFKLGRYFEVATTTKEISYRITIDVDDWLRQPDTWLFPIVEMSSLDNRLSEREPGTDITIMELTEESRKWLATPYNVANLKTEISRRHQHHIDNGLTISLNGVSIPPSQLEFLVSGSPLLQPAFREYDRNDVHVRILAGVGTSIPREAGWYVYCNGRMVLDADRSRTTGWGEPRMMPSFHNQYARFRGATFFDSANPALLPWNTTKDDVDEGMPIFAEAYGLMVTVMQPVIRFLDAMDRELDEPEESRVLLKLVDNSAYLRPIVNLSRSDVFRYQTPPPLIPSTEPLISIQYQKPVWLVEAVKKSLRVQSARAAGEKTFDYYVDQEDINAT